MFLKEQVHVEISFGPDTDIKAFWDKVKGFGGVHLGGKNSRYTATYVGDEIIAMRVIEAAEQMPDHEIHAYYTSHTENPS